MTCFAVEAVVRGRTVLRGHSHYASRRQMIATAPARIARPDARFCECGRNRRLGLLIAKHVDMLHPTYNALRSSASPENSADLTCESTPQAMPARFY